MRRSTKEILKRVPKDATEVILRTGWVPDFMNDTGWTEGVTSQGITYHISYEDKQGKQLEKRGHIRTGNSLINHLLGNRFERAADTATEAYTRLTSQGISCKVESGTGYEYTWPLIN